MTGIPFIGESGYYPKWAGSSGRWVFQRTLITVGQILGDIARLDAAQVPVSDQIIVWAPRLRLPILSLMPSKIHNERQMAVDQLRGFALVCYGDQCHAPKPGTSYLNGLQPTTVIRENGIYPEQWLLFCPFCGARVGPDLGLISAMPLVTHWLSLGRPPLENPGAAAILKSAPAITDFPNWIQKLEPSHLELAYVGQQMWPDIEKMLAAMTPKMPPPV